MAGENDLPMELISEWRKIKKNIQGTDKHLIKTINLILDSLKADIPANVGLGKLEKFKDLVVRTEQVLLSQTPATTDLSTLSAAEKADKKSEPTSIEKFFETVGQGVINAQQQLDRLSAEYITNQTVQMQPAVYRIPKVSAEIHFAIEKMSEKGFNVFVYGSSEAHRQEQQHKVSFDILAAPPPPDMNQRLQKIDIGGTLLTDPFSRQNAKKQLEDFLKGNAAGAPIGKRFLKERIPIFLEHFERVIIVTDKQVRALILPLKIKEQVYNLDVIYLVTTAGVTDITDDLKADAARQTLTRLKRLNRLAEILYRLSDQQQLLLQELEHPNA